MSPCASFPRKPCVVRACAIIALAILGCGGGRESSGSKAAAPVSVAAVSATSTMSASPTPDADDPPKPAPARAPDPPASSTSSLDDDPPPVKPQGTLRLTGACVDPSQHAARLVASRHPGSKASDWTDLGVARYDLDGDGTEDLIIDGGAANITHTLFFFIMRGTCGHYIGTYDIDFNPEPLPSSHHGLFDLGGTVACVIDCCPTSTFREMEFDGSRYRMVRSRPVQNECPTFSF